jgi:hypothetical protein
MFGSFLNQNAFATGTGFAKSTAGGGFNKQAGAFGTLSSSGGGGGGGLYIHYIVL